eukprot:485972-Pleurochrysis_carterae.AAC.1
MVCGVLMCPLRCRWNSIFISLGTSSALASPGRPALEASFKVRARAFRHVRRRRNDIAMLPRHGGWTRRGVHTADRSQ